MKKTISALLSALIAAGACTALPMTASGADLLNSTFESGLDGWSARGTGTKVELTATQAASGSQSAAVTNRSDSWNGIAYTLSSSVCTPGETYSFSAMVTQQASPAAVHFKLSLEYTTGDGGMGGFGGFGGQATYATIAEKDCASGMWTQLSNASYTIPADAVNPVLYIETEDSKIDFFVDNIIISTEGSVPNDDPPQNPSKIGDVTGDQSVDKKDAEKLLDYLLGKTSEIDGKAADLDNNKKLNAADLSILKDLIMNPPVVTTTTTTQTQPTQTTTVSDNGGQPSSGSHASPKEYMAKISASMTQNVPGSAKGMDQGSTKKFTYFSKKANRNKSANVWLPAGYSDSKKYCVLYMNHGIFGNEDSMLSGFNVREMASSLIASGEAEPFIIIFSQMYTDPASENPGMGMTMSVMDHYDDFLYDLTESLMPYVEEHWSVKTGRDNTAVAGFSMGGRESLYLGIMRPDLFGYVCASSPAPGIVPASDAFLSNHLGSYKADGVNRMKNEDFKISDADLPYLLMIGGGTNDSVVGTFPKQYHELFDKNGTTNIWMEVPGAGHDGGVGTPLFYNFFKAMFKA